MQLGHLTLKRAGHYLLAQAFGAGLWPLGSLMLPNGVGSCNKAAQSAAMDCIFQTSNSAQRHQLHIVWIFQKLPISRIFSEISMLGTNRKQLPIFGVKRMTIKIW